MIHRAIGSARTVSLVGDVYALLLTGEETGGAFSLTHGIVPPGGGPPMHTHAREDETFYVLEGTVSFFTQGKRIEAGPGAVVHLPRGIAHRFENTGGRPARVLIHVVPGGGFDRMLLEAGTEIQPGNTTPVPDPPDAMAHLLEACARAGISIESPPGR